MDRFVDSIRSPRSLALAAGLAASLTAAACGGTGEVTTNNNGPVHRAAGEAPSSIEPSTTQGTTAGTIPLETIPGTAPLGTVAPETTVTTATPETTIPVDQRPSHLIFSDGVGKIALGQTKAEVDKTYSLTSQCGDLSYSVTDAHADMAITFDAQNKVNQIFVHGIGVGTSSGIEVGSKQEAVTSAYAQAGGPTTSILQGANGNLNVLVVEGANADTNFVIKPMDGAQRVSSIVITQANVSVNSPCD